MDTQYSNLGYWIGKMRLNAQQRALLPALSRMKQLSDESIENAELSPELHALLFQMASHGTSLPWSVADSCVIRLQSRGIDTSHVLLALAGDKKAHSRFVSLSMLRRVRPPSSTVDAVLLALIKDRSEKVATSAAEVACYYYRKRWMVPELEEAAKRFSAITIFVSLLRDGYVLRREPSQNVNIKALSDFNFGTVQKDVPETEFASRPTEEWVKLVQTQRHITDQFKEPLVLEEARTSKA